MTTKPADFAALVGRTIVSLTEDYQDDRLMHVELLLDNGRRFIVSPADWEDQMIIEEVKQ